MWLLSSPVRGPTVRFFTSSAVLYRSAGAVRLPVTAVADL
jgi:hypothetical protein